MAASVLFFLFSGFVWILQRWILLPLVRRVLLSLTKSTPITTPTGSVRSPLFIRLEPSGVGLEMGSSGDGHCKMARSQDSQETVIYLTIHCPLRFICRMLLDAKVGLGESYMAGEWDARPSTKHFICYLIDKRREITSRGEFSRRRRSDQIPLIRSSIPPQKCHLEESRRNVQAHYDLGNDLFRLFLDQSMTYSCALFFQLPQKQLCDSDTALLGDAQMNKYDRIMDLMELEPHRGRGLSVLEVGCGWGGFGKRLRHRFPHVEWTGLTLSEEQFHWATKEMGDGSMAKVRLADYRQESEWHRYDRIVAIEMIEAVGQSQLDAFFRHLSKLLRPGGLLVIQAIVCPDERYESYSRQKTDFIRKHIFPGGHMPSLGAIRDACNLVGGGMRIVRVERMGRHYEPTLDIWSSAWQRHRRKIISELGKSKRFFRKWEFYFALCSALFARGNIDVVQLVVKKA